MDYIFILPSTYIGYVMINILFKNRVISKFIKNSRKRATVVLISLVLFCIVIGANIIDKTTLRDGSATIFIAFFIALIISYRDNIKKLGETND